MNKYLKSVLSSVIVITSLFVASNTFAATLGVTGITAVKTYATADDSYTNGWSWNFNVTVPANETVLNMKFGDWASTLGTFPAGSNMQFYSPQSSNATSTSPISITASSTYSAPMYLIPGNTDIQITVEVKVPIGSAGASYSTSYGIQTNLNTPVITVTADITALPATVALT